MQRTQVGEHQEGRLKVSTGLGSSHPKTECGKRVIHQSQVYLGYSSESIRETFHPKVVCPARMSGGGETERVHLIEATKVHQTRHQTEKNARRGAL
jgi:hypothetical protein